MRAVVYTLLRHPLAQEKAVVSKAARTSRPARGPDQADFQLLLATMHIEILKHPIKDFQVRVVDAEGRTVRMFTYPTIESARRAATAWTVAYGDCQVNDKTGTKE